MRSATSVLIPAAGLVAFVTLMALAVAVFPGGSRFTPDAPSYSFLQNFWCDLFDRTTYGGHANTSRPFGIAASVLLPLALIPFWSRLPDLFPSAPALRRPVTWLGRSAMVGATLVPTPLHDAMILTAGPAGFAAHLLALAGLHIQRYGALASGGLLPLLLSLTNFTLWVLNVAVSWIPPIQTLALATFLVWVTAVLVTLHRLDRTSE